jgi:hypothetical protein
MLIMNRQARERILRHQARVDVAPQQSWSPEIVGFLLIVVAVLSTAGIIG